MPPPSAARISRLRDLYKTEEFARFFEWASDFKNDVSQTTVSRIQDQIGTRSDGTRGSVLDFCKKLEAAGCGRLVLGRHQRKTRMEWAYTLRSIGAVARGDTNELEPREAESDEEGSNQPAMMRIEIPLRANHPRASLELPEDATEFDIRKLIDFIQRHFLRT